MATGFAQKTESDFCSGLTNLVNVLNTPSRAFYIHADDLLFIFLAYLAWVYVPLRMGPIPQASLEGAVRT